MLVVYLMLFYKQMADLKSVIFIMTLYVYTVNVNIVAITANHIPDIGEKLIRKDRPSGLFLFYRKEKIYRKERKKYD